MAFLDCESVWSPGIHCPKHCHHTNGLATNTNNQVTHSNNVVTRSKYLVTADEKASHS